MKEGLPLIAVILILFVVNLFTCPDHKGTAPKLPIKSFILPAVILLTIHTVINLFPGTPAEASGGMYQYAPIRTITKAVLNVGTFIAIPMVYEWLKREDASIKQRESYVLMLSTLLSMYFTISVEHFLMFFIELEMASISMAALVAFDKYRHHSAEAGAEYIPTALFSDALLLFGPSMIYGTSGILYPDNLPEHITGNMLQVMAFVLFFAGVRFKVFLAPFHLWTVDVYEGIPTAVTSYLSVISKGSATSVLITILTKVSAPMTAQQQEILFWVTTASITIANLFTIRQQNLERFMASSIISQTGYIMLGIIGDSATGMTVLVCYVLIHLTVNLGVSAVTSIAEQRSNRVKIGDYNGLYRTNPKLIFIMIPALLPLAGILPFTGFFSKFPIFITVLDSGLHLLASITLINTVVSLYYYLLIVKAMYISPSEEPIPASCSDGYIKLGFALYTLGTIALGIISYIYQRIDKFT